jgi:cell wall-associated NlpC family hydrolase
MAEDLDARVFLVLMAGRMVGDYLYSWGGEEADEGGFDCSGFVSVALMQAARAWPKLYDGGRSTAQGLYDYYDRPPRRCPDITDIELLKPGCLVFYRKPGAKMHHVAIHAVNVPNMRLHDRTMEVGPVAFESGGGGGRTDSLRAALCSAAGVRLTASDRHGEGVEWVAKDPFLHMTG